MHGDDTFCYKIQNMTLSKVKFHTDALTDFHKQQAACHYCYTQAVELQEMLWHE